MYEEAFRAPACHGSGFDHLSFQTILIVLTGTDGGVIYQLAVLSFLQELMLVIIEVEVAEDDKVESSSDSPLIRWSRVDAGFRFCHYFDYICGMGFGGYVKNIPD